MVTSQSHSLSAGKIDRQAATTLVDGLVLN
jgi:hypothetical protein